MLKGVAVDRVNQVWAADITYLPMSRGFLYLVAIMDWHSRYVLAWKYTQGHQPSHNSCMGWSANHRIFVGVNTR